MKLFTKTKKMVITYKITYKNEKLNSINTLTIVIEEAFNDNFSILAHDEEGGSWIEKFSNNLDDAKLTAEKLYKKIIKLY